MNKFKTMKYKTSNGNASNDGLFDKISKYSTVRFLRKSNGRKGATIGSSSSQQIAASYDMTGRESEDHKLEIGAPILISKTTIDADAIENDVDSSLHQRNSTQSSLGELKFSYYLPDGSARTQSATEEDLYDFPRNGNEDLETNSFKRSRSKSATNLHKTELSLYLDHISSSDCSNKKSVIRSISNHNINQNPLSEPVMEIIISPVAHRTTSKLSVNSIHSFTGNSSMLGHAEDDFDMKSASFQSLDARNIFLSIEELNDITKQINESDEFKSKDEQDLEYCAHRDNLRPDERRITLLRNKNQKLLNMGPKKDKLSNVWCDFKTWIGEERIKIKEVVNKHAALQRVGANQAAAVAESDNNDEKSENIIRNQVSLNGSMANVNNDHVNFNEVLDISSDESTLNRFGSRRVVGSEDRGNNSDTMQSHSSSIGKEKLLEGQNGFEELRRYVKQGSDFGKDLVTVLQERVDSEQLYAKSLSKMASKLNKACREVPGTLADAWRNVAAEMESRSEVHRQFSNTMIEEIVKPLKQLLDNQHKTRKAIEGSVEKSARILSEWRTSEAKSKKSSHAAARENEKLQDAMLDVRIQRSPSVAMVHHNQSNTATINSNCSINSNSNNNNNINNNNTIKETSNGTSILNLHKQSIDKEIKNAEKDCVKLDNKRRKAEESVKRADVEYYTLCIRAERARVEWEMSVLRGSSVLQSHEHQRLENLKIYLTSYLKLSTDMNPNLNAVVERLTPHVNACNVQKDLTVVKNIRRVSEGPSEQLLPDFYCEHTTLAMNRDRRKHALIKLLQLVRADLEKERKSRSGLKGLSQSLNAQETQNVADKLYHIRSMLTYLEGARFKLQSALLELDHKPRGSHPLAPHIQITRDRTGLQQSILKVPLWLKNGDEEKNNGEVNDTNHCVDGRNDALIRNFDRNLNRSKSNVDYGVRGPLTVANGPGTANTIIVDSRALENIEFDRGIADGGSNQQDSDYDEFSSQDEDDDLCSSRNSIQTAMNRRLSNNGNHSVPKIISRCKAIYAYSPKLDDELEIIPGDLIDVHVKQEDGWWVGALKNRVGIFPATYVEEIL